MLKSSLKGKNSKLIRGALNKTQFREQSESLFLTSGFIYQTAEQAEAIFKGDETGFQYTRYANPTIDTFEKRMAVIDGSGSCFATASGMAAVFASLMCQLKAGDHVVSATALFGSCREVIKNIITRYGIEVSFVDGKNIDSWKKEIKPNTKIFFFETPSNPCLEIVDIEAVCKLAKKNNKKILVFAEDVAASGGYLIACAGDEIYANSSSIVGSVGVISASFGFQDAIKKIGVERRVYTAGKNKSTLDPFKEEKEEDIQRLKKIQLELHSDFINVVKSSRGSKLIDTEKNNTFTGEFWSGSSSLKLGLIDGIGNAEQVLREKFGEDVIIKKLEKPKSFLAKKLSSSLDNQIDSIANTLEERAQWQKFGL